MLPKTEASILTVYVISSQCSSSIPSIFPSSFYSIIIISMRHTLIFTIIFIRLLYYLASLGHISLSWILGWLHHDLLETYSLVKLSMRHEINVLLVFHVFPIVLATRKHARASLYECKYALNQSQINMSQSLTQKLYA